MSDEGWTLVDLSKYVIEGALDEPHFTVPEHALMAAGTLRREWLAEHDAWLWSLYVPNGRGLDDPHYAYKLRFFDALRQYTADALAADPSLALALTGDFNVAPTDADNGDPSIVEGVTTHVSPAERNAFSALNAAGLQDVVRPLVPDGFTFWDYKQLRFPRNEGLRIDFVLGSRAFADAVEGATIERDERTGEGPSDHVPVVVDLNFDEDDEDVPMIFG